MKNVKKPDLDDRIWTAQHELSHGLIAYALGCIKINVKVYKSGKAKFTNKALKCMGVCEFSPPVLTPQIGIFVGAGPFASPAYRLGEDDQLEFNQLVADYRRLTKLPAGTIRSFVLDPVNSFLESQPILDIIGRIAPVLAEGGILRAPKGVDLERFFPKTLNRAMLEAMKRELHEAAFSYPFA